MTLLARLERTWEDLEVRLQHRKVHPHPNPPETPVAPACPVVQVVLQNHSSVVTDDEIRAAMVDLQTQVCADFAPHWLTEAVLHGPGVVPALGDYILSIEDEPTVQGALGFHEELNGVPTGHIFARTCEQYGVPWTVTASHELLEMLGDPRTNMIVSVDADAAGTSGQEYAAEACDAVEQSTYLIGQTAVSNFVTPAWFDPSAASGPYDHLGQLQGPLELLPGGSYIGTRSFTSPGWTQQTAEKAPERGWPDESREGKP